jgi:hypothetical protein
MLTRLTPAPVVSAPKFGMAFATMRVAHRHDIMQERRRPLADTLQAVLDFPKDAIHHTLFGKPAALHASLGSRFVTIPDIGDTIVLTMTPRGPAVDVRIETPAPDALSSDPNRRAISKTLPFTPLDIALFRRLNLAPGGTLMPLKSLRVALPPKGWRGKLGLYPRQKVEDVLRAAQEAERRRVFEAYRPPVKRR